MLLEAKIAVVFPKSNAFSSNKTKPVILASKGYIKFSNYKNNMLVISPFSKDIDTSICEVCVIGKKESKSRLLYKRKVLEVLLKQKPKMVEVHQDMALAGYLAKHLPDIKVNGVKHGDGFFHLSKERHTFFRLFYYHLYLKHLHKIYCISEYVKNNLSKLYPKLASKMLVVYNSYGNLTFDEINYQVKKQKLIIYVGKAVSYKGFYDFIQAVTSVLKEHQDYKAIVIAGVFSSKKKYSNLILKASSQKDVQRMLMENKLEILKGLEHKEVFKKMQQAQIAVIPTKTQEPFGLVALEYHLAKCAVISSGNGGLKEISSSNALYLNKVSSEDIKQHILTYINDDALIKKMSEDGYRYALDKFNPEKLCHELDEVRKDQFQS